MTCGCTKLHREDPAATKASVFPDSTEASVSAATLHYPMHLMSWEVLMGLEVMAAHQVLKQSGRLKEWSEALAGCVFLVSHEWLGYLHPDPSGEQLAVLKGALARMASGQASVRPARELRPVRGAGDWEPPLPGRPLAAALRGAYFWLDYASVPQEVWLEPASARAPAEQRFEMGLSTLAQDVRDALQSLPAYVERSAALLVLAPSCHHRNAAGRACGAASWRGRGWCRLELCAALLAQRRVRVIRIVGVAAAPELLNVGDAAFLPPGLGEYSCCARDHTSSKGSIQCDKVRIAGVLRGMVEAAAAGLEEAGDVFRRRALLCSRARFLQGLPKLSTAAPETPLDLKGFQELLRWTTQDSEAGKTGQGPSLLHWAALAGAASVIPPLLQFAADRPDINGPMPAPAGGSGFDLLHLGLPPLHLAACSADGRPDAMAALLDAGADAPAQRGGLSAPACAALFGAPRHLQAWLARFPAWAADRSLGPGLLARAAAGLGPGRAPVVALLIAGAADVRAGAAGLARADAALLLACAKEDSDPEAVALLLRARSSPFARVDPTYHRSAAAHAALRLAAQCAGAGSAAAALAEVEGATPLHLAARRGDVPVLRVLLQAGADPALRDEMGRTALEAAPASCEARGPLEAVLSGEAPPPAGVPPAPPAPAPAGAGPLPPPAAPLPPTAAKREPTEVVVERPVTLTWL